MERECQGKSKEREMYWKSSYMGTVTAKKKLELSMEDRSSKAVKLWQGICSLLIPIAGIKVCKNRATWRGHFHHWGGSKTGHRNR